jgi:hypothetical protein
MVWARRWRPPWPFSRPRHRSLRCREPCERWRRPRRSSIGGGGGGGLWLHGWPFHRCVGSIIGAGGLCRQLHGGLFFLLRRPRRSSIGAGGLRRQLLLAVLEVDGSVSLAADGAPPFFALCWCAVVGPLCAASRAHRLLAEIAEADGSVSLAAAGAPACLALCRHTVAGMLGATGLAHRLRVEADGSVSLTAAAAPAPLALCRRAVAGMLGAAGLAHLSTAHRDSGARSSEGTTGRRDLPRERDQTATPIDSKIYAGPASTMPPRAESDQTMTTEGGRA